MKTTSIIGKIIIVLSFIISLNPFALVFMLPCFVLGSLLVWSKRTSILSNILWSILPLIMWYPALILITLGSVFTDQKFDFYLEENFTGYVNVVNHMKCGQSVQKKNGREQLYIPSTGILMYKGNIRAGVVNHRYYYKMKNDSLVLIPQRSPNGDFYNWTDNKPPSNLNVAWGVGRISRGSHILPTDFDYTVTTLKIGSIDSLERYNELESFENFEDKTDIMVRNCLK